VVVRADRIALQPLCLLMQNPELIKKIDEQRMIKFNEVSNDGEPKMWNV